MSALVKIFPGTGKAAKYLIFTPDEETVWRPSRDLMGLEVGKTSILAPKETFSFSFGTLALGPYHALVSISPHLAQHINSVVLATTWAPHTCAPLYLSFRTTRALDLASIGPLITVNLVD